MNKLNETILFVLLAVAVAMMLTFSFVVKDLPGESVPGMDGWVSYSNVPVPEDIPFLGVWGYYADEFVVAVRFKDGFYEYSADPSKPTRLLYEDPPYWWILMPGAAR